MKTDRTVQYSTVQYSAVQYCTVQYLVEFAVVVLLRVCCRELWVVFPGVFGVLVSRAGHRLLQISATDWKRIGDRKKQKR